MLHQGAVGNSKQMNRHKYTMAIVIEDLPEDLSPNDFVDCSEE